MPLQYIAHRRVMQEQGYAYPYRLASLVGLFAVVFAIAATPTHSAKQGTAQTPRGHVPEVPTQAANTGAFEYVGSLGGDIRTLAVVSTLLYIGEGSTLRILDVSDPTSPRRIGSYGLLDTVNQVQVRDSTVYIATNQGLFIIDANNPAHPVLIGSYQGIIQALGMDVVGELAYVAAYDQGLQIIDVSHPEAPVLQGSYTTNPAFEDVQVVGNTAYVANGGELLVIDVTNAHQPKERGKFRTTLGAIRNVRVDGNFVYAGSDGGIQIVDVTDPSSPSLCHSQEVSGTATDVQIVDGLAYVTYTSDSGGLQIIDVRDVDKPVVRGSYATNSAYAVQVIGSMAYVASINFANPWQARVQIIDVSDPGHIALRGAYVVPAAFRAAQVVGSLAFGINASTLQVIDIANPHNPVLRGSYTVPRTTSGDAYLETLQIVGNLAYVVGSGGLYIIDVSNPDQLTLRGTYRPTSFSYASDVQVVGGLAFVTTGNLDILDVHDPSNPVLRKQYSNFSFALQVRVIDQFAYVLQGPDPVFGSTAGSLVVVDISNVDNPTTVTTLSLGQSAGIAQAQGNVLYVYSEYKVKAIDVSDHRPPVFRNDYGALRIYGFYADDDFAYALTYEQTSGYGSAQLRVLDIRNPVAPVLRASYPLWSYVIYTRDDLIFLTDNKGLQILRVHPENFLSPQVFLPLIQR